MTKKAGLLFRGSGFAALAAALTTAALMSAAIAGFSLGQEPPRGRISSILEVDVAAAPRDVRTALEIDEILSLTAAGRSYSREFSRKTMPWLAPAINKRVEACGGPSDRPFIVLVRIDASGRADNVLIWPESCHTDGLKQLLLAADYPKPPLPSWWVKAAEVSFSRTPPAPRPAAAEPKLPTVAGSEGAGILYSGTLAVRARAPEGWLVDVESGVGDGRPMVMYPSGKSWSPKPGGDMMILSVSPVEGGESSDAFIRRTINALGEGMKAKKLEPIVLATGESAELWLLPTDAAGPQVCLAFARRGDDMAMFDLWTQDAAAYDRWLEPFRKMVAGSLLVGLPAAAGAGAEPTVSPIPGGYTYWSRFKAGTYVTFRYRMKSGAGEADMLKQVLLKEVAPDSVALEFAECPYDALDSRPADKPAASLYPFTFAAAGEDFDKKDLFGGQLSISPAFVLEEPEARRADAGVEDIVWKGGRIRAARKKIEIEKPGALTTINIWLTDAVPGMVAGMDREIEGQVSLREEFRLEDFKAIPAGPDEADRLRAARKPAVVETTVADYHKAHFRFDREFDSFNSDLVAAIGRTTGASKYDYATLMAKFSPLFDKLARIRRELAEDEKSAAEELGETEAAKLGPLISLMKAKAGLMVKWLEAYRDQLFEQSADHPDRDIIEARREEIAGTIKELNAASMEYVNEYMRSGPIHLKFTSGKRDPRT